MRIDARRVDAFVRDPGTCRVVLFHGDDAGLIRLRAETMTRAVAGALDDPFRVAELDRNDIASLVDEAATLSLTGGRRVVRLREVTDAAATAAVQAVLASRAPALVVIEGAGLATRSRLRTLLEAAPDGAAIACYPEDGRALAETIRHVLHAADVQVDREALAWLGSQLGADRASTQAEVEKLALYAGPGGTVDLQAAMTCVGDLAGLSLDDALFAATDGDVATTDRALELAIAEGATAVGVIRAALMHLQRLHRARLAVDDGASPADATKAARPPVFFRRLGAFSRALGLWSTPTLVAVLAAMADAERACKRTGAPDVVICRNAVLTLARRAAAVRAR
ncbi:MAG TPA: DNA polymerase III subunit delta [Acetobacteraceae bacterium]|jgi:DNA polymerase-3 subunit delta|nr:DNA polymerase III subunit delta [Acetobacteraceae bacterium]